MAAQRGFFDLDERYAALLAAGDPLEKSGGLIDFTKFCPRSMRPCSALMVAGGRSPAAGRSHDAQDFDPADALRPVPRAGRVPDPGSPKFSGAGIRLGRFLGLDDGDYKPGGTTIWRFREALVRSDAIEALFARFDAHLNSLCYLIIGGQIADASIIQAPRWRMTDEERADVREGGIPRLGRRSQQDFHGKTVMRAGRSSEGAARTGRMDTLIYLRSASCEA